MLIRDPIHGDIELGRLEAAVLDLPALQRLRGIKQLGTAHLVYPGALHTRFDHSVGACAAAHRLVDGLRRNGTAIAADEINAIEARYADLWRFYVFVPGEAAGRAVAAATERFGITSEFNNGKRLLNSSSTAADVAFANRIVTGWPGLQARRSEAQ